MFKRRLWFYGSYRNQRVRQGVLGYYVAPGVPGEYNVLLTNLTAKLTGQVNPKHRFTGFVQAQKKDYPERNADAYRYKEATWHQIFKPLAGKGEWSWMVSDKTFVNAFVGRWQYVTDALNYTEDPAAYDTVTLRYWGRFNTSPYVGGRGRWQYNASVSHYIPSAWGGSHDLKAGMEITDEDRTYDADARSNGADYQLRFQNGVPYQVVVYNYPYYTLNKMSTQSMFFRDAWRFCRPCDAQHRRPLRAVSRLPARSSPSQPGASTRPGPSRPPTCSPGTTGHPAWGCPCPSDKVNRTVVKATYGWYNFATQATYGDTYNRNAASTTTYRWHDLNKNLDYNDGEFGDVRHRRRGLRRRSSTLT